MAQVGKSAYCGAIAGRRVLKMCVLNLAGRSFGYLVDEGHTDRRKQEGRTKKKKLADLARESGVLVIVRLFGRRLLHVCRRWQIRMHILRIGGCGFDGDPCRADSPLDFPFQSLPTDRTRCAARPSLFWFRLRRPTLRPNRLFSFGERDLPTP